MRRSSARGDNEGDKKWDKEMRRSSVRGDNEGDKKWDKEMRRSSVRGDNEGGTKERGTRRGFSEGESGWGL